VPEALARDRREELDPGSHQPGSETALREANMRIKLLEQENESYAAQPPICRRPNLPGK
jgi:hypothetical protein